MVYHCPSDPGARSDTSYVVVVGRNTAFPGSKGIRLTDVKGDAAHTILAVETMQSGIHWMEPRDLSLADALRGINATPGPAISSRHFEDGGVRTSGAHATFADGSARWLSTKIDPAVLGKLLDINGPKPALAEWNGPTKQ